MRLMSLFSVSPYPMDYPYPSIGRSRSLRVTIALGVPLDVAAALKPMSDRESEPAPAPRSSGESLLFATESRIAGTNATGEKAERDRLPWIVAAVAILLLAGVAFLFGFDRTRAGSATAASVAAHLVFSNVHVTQTSNFAADQLTYVDGVVLNRGHRTVTSVTVGVQFASSTGDPPQVEQAHLRLVRTHQPLVETETVNAAPLFPGSARDFRLIFENISPAWNRQIPTVTVENLAFLR